MKAKTTKLIDTLNRYIADYERMYKNGVLHINNFGYIYTISNSLILKQLYVAETFKINLSRILRDIQEYTTDYAASIDDVKNYLQIEYDRYVKMRMEYKPVPYNTDPMKNLTSLWEFESAVDFIKILKSLLNIVSV